MAKTVLELTPEERRAYQPIVAIRDRKREREAEVEKRWVQARRVAAQAAKLLRQEFGAKQVLLFGSVADRAWFTAWSDIDLAVWGLSPDRFFAAVAAVTGLSPDFKIDLVDPESCSSSLRSMIEREGVEL